MKKRKKWKYGACWAILGLIICSGLSLAVNLFIRLPENGTKPIDAVFVLGGSINREIKAAQLSSHNTLPILISQGSPDPCIWFIFQREQARTQGVLLEKCAQATFDNYFFALPILKRWGVHKLMLITSASHLPRAELIGSVLLHSQGIAYELNLVHEKGSPGNQESRTKTLFDLARAYLWAPIAQIIAPPCWNMTELSQVNLKDWQNREWKCERQAHLEKQIEQYFQSPPNHS